MKTPAITPISLWKMDAFAWRWPAIGAAMLAIGLLTHQSIASGAALVVLLYAAGTSPWLRAHRAKPAPSPRVVTATPPQQEPPDEPPPSTTESLVRQMLRQHRYALLLRPEIVDNLTPAQVAAARNALEQAMALVPAGEIRLGAGWRTEDDGEPLAPRAAADGAVVQVDTLWIDRCCVTNEQYQAFVDAGGYTEMSLWEPRIWPGVLDFVDQTGHPGPLFWSDGRFPAGLARHPVVGVSWYEAAAYARWCGKRLPTNPEWEKTASWPAETSATNRPLRRFPWGDSLDPTRANLWLTGAGSTVPVDEFAAGASIGGVYQLVGNVWEWTSSNFGAFGGSNEELILATVLKSVRGGAFDTYFENQATCQFESGEDPTARQHNIGFRCAVSWCDLDLRIGQPAESETSE